MNWYAKAIIIGIAAAAIGGAFWWTYSSGHEAGEAKANAAWQKREIEQQATYAAAQDELRRELGRGAAVLQRQIADATAAYEMKREEAKRARAESEPILRGLRDGTIVLRDPGAAADPPGRSGGAAGPAASGSCDGEETGRGRLSPRLAEFLFSEADRADREVTELEVQLELAQSTIGAYYQLAKDCSAAGASKR